MVPASPAAVTVPPLRGRPPGPENHPLYPPAKGWSHPGPRGRLIQAGTTPESRPPGEPSSAMDTQGLPDKIGQDIRDAVRRIEQHRAMLAQMVAVQVQALGELRGLLRRGGGSGAGGVTPGEVDEEVRATALAGDLIAGRAGRPARATPKVLLIDDDPTTRNLISHFLRKENYIVEKAAGGSDGLARAKSGRPDLLIIDAAVPGMNSFELLSLLRRDPDTSGIPVLMLSSLDEEEAIIKSLDEGADYVIKPFSPRILIAKIKKTLKDACPHAVDHRPL